MIISARIALTCVIAGLGGCGTMHRGVVPVAGIGTESSATSFAVDVQNQLGSVNIRIDRSITVPTVSAMATDDRGRTRAASWAAADLEASEPFPILRVLVTPPEGGVAEWTDVTVTVPACAGLRVRNQGGTVTANQLHGAIDVQNGSGVAPGGDVTLTLASPLIDPLMIRTSTGNVLLTMPSGSGGNFTLLSGSGQIALNANNERLQSVQSDARNWSGRLNDGHNDVRIIADTGSVILRIWQ